MSGEDEGQWEQRSNIYLEKLKNEQLFYTIIRHSLRGYKEIMGINLTAEKAKRCFYDLLKGHKQRRSTKALWIIDERTGNKVVQVKDLVKSDEVVGWIDDEP